MNNYEFCVDFAKENLPPGGRMLDYGCGAGRIVDLALARNLDAVGCDVFYDGGDYSSEISAEKFGNTIFRMNGDNIPFENEVFDLVVSNQVLEHVPNLDVVVSEITRVLKPGGVVLSLFPDKGVWREGHCGVPLLHWFPKESSFRVNYAHLLRSLGFGNHKSNKPHRVWAKDFCKYLDDWTHYRSTDEIVKTFKTHLSEPNFIEADYFSKRLGKDKIPPSIRSWIVKKWAGRVFTATKSN